MQALGASLRSFRWFEILFILLLGLTPLLWYGQDTIVFGHDTGFPLDPAVYFSDRLFTWSQLSGLGLDQGSVLGALPIHGLEALVGSLGFSLTTIQKIVFSFWFVAPGLAMYALLHYLDGRSGAWVFRLTGSALYMLNHFLLEGWSIAERTKFSLVTALPLVLLLVLRTVDGRTGPVKAGMLIGLTVGVFNGGGFAPLYAPLLLTSALAVVFFGLRASGEREAGGVPRMAKLVIAAAASFMLVNAYWLLPQLRTVATSYGAGLEMAGGIDAIVGWAGAISQHASLLNLFRLQGNPGWYIEAHQYSGLFLNHRLLIVASALLPLLAFAPLFRQSRHMATRYVLFFTLLALVAMIFTGGTHPPLGFIYGLVLEHVPGFAVFRTPYYKFGSALWLAYAVLIALSASALVDWVRGRFYGIHGSRFAAFGLGAVFVGAIVGYDYPVFSGAFFNYQPPLTMMVRVPDYVFDFGRWSKSEPGFGRVVLVPPLSDADTYVWGHMSLVLVPSYFTPTLADTALGMSAEEFALVDDLYDSLRAGDTDAALDRASSLGARYFLLRSDVLERRAAPGISFGPIAAEERPAVYEAILRSSDDLSLIERWGEWSVFEIAESRRLPHIYSALPESVAIGEEEPGRVATMYSVGPPPQIRFQRINPTKYRVQVEGAESPFMLVFADRYSPDWNLYQASGRADDIVPVASYLDGQVLEGEGGMRLLDPQMAETWTRGQLPEDFHVKVNGYANGWYLTNTGTYDLIIEYWPQRLVHLGLAITIVSTVSAVGYLAVSSLRGWRKRDGVQP